MSSVQKIWIGADPGGLGNFGVGQFLGVTVKSTHFAWTVRMTPYPVSANV